MTATLPPFPVHDQALDVLEEALTTSFDAGPDGPVPAAGGFSVGRVLEFFSGHDDTLSVPDGSTYTYHGPLYHERDVLLALIGEVRRLRHLIAEGRR